MQNEQQNPNLAPQQNNFQPTPVVKSKRPLFSRGNIFIIVAVVLLVLIIVGVAYAYVMKIGPFAVTSPYTEKNLLSGILEAASKIKSSSYSVSMSLAMGERDNGAKPFISKLSNTDEIIKQYKNDYARANGVTYILGQLAYQKTGAYPATLAALRSSYASSTAFVGWISDPVTGKEYNYSVTEGGSNFALVINFETNDAISAIKKAYNFSDITTIINGKTVTFTKDSPSYLYLSSTLPKPFIVTLSDYSAYLPPESKFSGSISAQSDLNNEDSADWKFNIDAGGDYGDMTYKANLDALKKDGMYYFRINNMPGFLLLMLGLDKGQWVKIDPSKTQENNYSTAGSLASGLPETEKFYKEHRQEITDLLKKIIETADSDGLIHLKNSVRAEKIDGRELFRYDLEISKNAIVTFYKHLQQEVEKTDITSDYPMVIDTGYIEYLQSPEFSEIFDYYQENSSLTLWTDSQGYPAVLSYSFRIIPPDSATQLKNKQANIDFRLNIDDINKPVNIEAPQDFKNIEEYSK